MHDTEAVRGLHRQEAKIGLAFPPVALPQPLCLHWQVHYKLARGVAPHPGRKMHIDFRPSREPPADTAVLHRPSQRGAGLNGPICEGGRQTFQGSENTGRYLENHHLPGLFVGVFWWNATFLVYCGRAESAAENMLQNHPHLPFTNEFDMC